MEDRIAKLNGFGHKNNVLYLMRRDKRIHDNYCVELGYNLSYDTKTKFYVGIEFSKLKINERQRTFVIEGLEEVEDVCRKYNIYFDLIGDLRKYKKEKNIDCIILDFSPLRECLEYRKELKEYCKENQISLYTCDANNMIPCKVLSVYKRTSKSVKIRLFEFWLKFLKDYKPLEEHMYNQRSETCIQKNSFPSKLTKNMFKGGYSSGMEMVDEFFKNRFEIYHKHRNNPEIDALSNLSPWISNGQISTQKVIYLSTQKFDEKSENLQTFINEVFVWKETADHFCFHEKNYDNLNGALPWARDTLKMHKDDKRERIYDLESLTKGQTNIPLWNAAQKEMLATGKMHGYCRMYWAKQILKWTKSPEEAVKIGCLLNDTYSIDGNSPNGYLGIMWSMCGTMDQGFKERPVIGKIRPMNEFKAPLYIKKWAYQ